MAIIATAGRYGLAEFFRTEFEQIKTPNTDADTRFYLGSMMDRYARSDQFFSFDEDGIGIRPLALLYEDAYTTTSERERCSLLRQIGDQSLFIGAMFPQFYSRKGIARDYFVGMGVGAYGYLADHAPLMRDIYAKLAERFAQLLELIARVCNRYRKLDAHELLAIYQHWESTRDPALARQLAELGMVLK
ncbi:MAG: hypothetical protein HWE12_00800 [Oceanospirillaceae bacterium]|nr:hypothetical protein [Oceanospirillaceae bacterium]